MLTNEAKQEIRDCLRKIAIALPNFRSRAGQRAMIAEVAKTLGRHPDPPQDKDIPPERPEPGATIALIQGGTGIGKSLGYSLPATILARHKKKRLVIATATVALQEQLTEKDLPLFYKAAGLEVSVELAKGRSRYVCAYRLHQAVGDMRQLSMFNDDRDRLGAKAKDTGNGDDALRKMLDDMLDDYENERWNGDRDTRHGIEDALWGAITTDRHGCLGQNCPSLKICAQVEAKKRLRAADVIVANHDLVLADLAMGGGKVLPPPAECFFIIDEGHHFPEKAVSAFSSRHLLDSARHLAERIGGFASSLSKVLGPAGVESAKIMAEAAGRLEASLTEAFTFFASLSQLVPSDTHPKPVLEFEQSCLPEEFFGVGANILTATETILSRLQGAMEALASKAASEPVRKVQNDKLVSDCGYYAARIHEIQETWKLFLTEPEDGQPPIAKWVEGLKTKRGIDFQINASPVRSAGFLVGSLWKKAAGVILTSATLKTLGTFNDFLFRSGLSMFPNLPCLDLPSSFDYPNQGTISIPQMRALPSNYSEHTREVAERVAALCETLTGGMLVLFASRRQMSDVAAAMPSSIKEALQVQGSDSKNSILTRHKERIDAGKASVLFGLESFSEGVDLAGKYCTRVVITKLPFDVPDDPVLKALSNWVEQRGGRPFNEIFVPAAARKLEQRVGRLIRSESDVGEVIVMDMRLSDTQYGKMMLRGLPPFRLVVKGEELLRQ